MIQQLPFKKGSLLFAPMEGITDPCYRQVLFELYPEWDYFYCDFLRAPGEGELKEQKILNHFGQHIYDHQSYKNKTAFQILTTTKAQTLSTVEKIRNLNFTHLDLNLGCPSKKVNSHGGGAYLLSELLELEGIIQKIRKNYPHLFSVKIRLGHKNSDSFDDLLAMLENNGVDYITIHARTRDDLYRAPAKWQYIARAVERCRIPIVGNGDIWQAQDIQRMFKETDCYAVMCARGALKTPWMARLYKNNLLYLNEEELLQIRIQEITRYFYQLKQTYYDFGEDISETFLLARFKGISRYLFDDFKARESIRKILFRSQDLDQFFSHLSQLNDLLIERELTIG